MENIYDQAISILELICMDLDLGESSSDPYPLDADYIAAQLEDTQGLIWYDDDERSWTYNLPTLEQAQLIVDAHPFDAEPEGDE